MLTIHLEESDCFSAWVSAKEVGMGLPNDGTDPKRESGTVKDYRIKISEYPFFIS